MMSLSSPHTVGQNSVSKVMLSVFIAIIPGLACLVYYFSAGYAINLLLLLITSLSVEAVILTLRKRPVLFFLKDGSIIVTAALLAVALPPLAPWWVTVIAGAVAAIFGKHLFGGLGQNPFNPAMVAYAMVLISLPVFMTTRWASIESPSGLLESMSIIFGINLESVDGFTGATPLDYYKLNIERLTASEVLSSPLLSSFGAPGWTPVNIVFLLGGVWLWYRKIITWHIPLGVLGALALMAVLFSTDADLRVPFHLHLLAGSTMLAAFFIATDPVSAATSNKGKLIYGAGIGVLIYTIRTWGNYPDATAFAILIMNFAAPLIDHYTRPRVYGHTDAVKGYKK
ncbi:RnfABCDGE type electron transport complex subunit D [Reinekea forsetii]|nr:RnfABCDGE type electron transport complex subunit D [Reinekea forsetii]